MKLETTLSHAVVGLYLCVIFRVVALLIASASLDSSDLPDSGQHVREENKSRMSIYRYFSQNLVYISGSLCLRMCVTELEKVWKCLTRNSQVD